MSKYIDDTVHALADPSRRAAVELLAAGPKRAGQLAQALGASAPLASRHLRILLQSNLVDVVGDRNDARARIYHLRPERLDELYLWLGEVSRAWANSSPFDEQEE